jgi:hypothetical protein
LIVCSVLIVATCIAAGAQGSPPPTFNVLTWQDDFGRTGMNLKEGTLVSPLSGFGQLCHADLDGQVYAQPLIVTNVKVTANGSAHTYASVAYVVTQSGTLYAINATAPSGSHGYLTTCNIIPNASNTLTRFPF